MKFEDTARRLWQARLTGESIDVTEIALPRTANEAYAIQTEIQRLSGEVRVGYKVGSTSLEAQRKLGTGEPGAGPLLGRFVLASPATFAVSALHHPCVEGEFAFRLDRALPARAEPYARDEVAAAIGAVAGAIEIVGTRFAGGLDGKGRLLTTADGGVNIALVTGRWVTVWQGFDLPAHPVVMRINGVAKGAGTGARALGDPVTVMVWLANHLSARGIGLAAGEIVSTGTCTGLDAVAAGDRVVADFGVLGTVDIALTALGVSSPER